MCQREHLISDAKESGNPTTMVDFKKRLAAKVVEAVTDPVKLYDTLDRATNKGPLRPAQTDVLEKWFASHPLPRDVIVKLHTGQGKTLIGLLILLARLNEKKGPAVYLCPDNFLIEQTCTQAKEFGVATCVAEPDLPEEFIDGKKLLVTSVQKLFNGLTRFGLHKKSIEVGTLLMDDAHACADIIRQQCRIRLPATDPAYSAIRTLFAADLEGQGAGSYADTAAPARLPPPAPRAPRRSARPHAVSSRVPLSPQTLRSAAFQATHARA